MINLKCSCHICGDKIGYDMYCGFCKKFVNTIYIEWESDFIWYLKVRDWKIYINYVVDDLENTEEYDIQLSKVRSNSVEIYQENDTYYISLNRWDLYSHWCENTEMWFHTIFLVYTELSYIMSNINMRYSLSILEIECNNDDEFDL